MSEKQADELRLRIAAMTRDGVPSRVINRAIVLTVDRILLRWPVAS